MHYFRAFAILNIIAVHFLHEFGRGDIKDAWFQNSTVYFLLISGYLCEYLNSDLQKFSAKRYYVKKLQNVIAPYVFWSIVFLATLGALPIHFWYIPFISIVFLFSPVLLRLKNRALLIVTSIFAALFFIFPNRPMGLGSSFGEFLNLYAHFTVFYLLGMLYARFKDLRLKWVYPFAALFAFLSAFYPIAVVGSLQKLAFSILVLPLLALIPPRLKVLDLIAKYSFALYFIHLAVLHALVCFLPPRIIASPWSLSLYIPYVAFTLALCVGMKKLFARHSRLFLGA